MKQLSTLLSFFVFATALSAQMPGMRPGGGMGAGQTGRFYGRIVDSLSGKGVDAASVQLISTRMDMATRKRKDSVINGMLTNPNGDFTLENVPLMGDYTLRVSVIGFKPIDQKVSFLTADQQKQLMQVFMKMNAARQGGDSTGKPATPPVNMMEELRKIFGGDMSRMAAMADKDLGNIRLVLDAKVLENVTVVGAKSMTLAVDRRIFNVDKNLAASGTTATDVLRQIPSVNVDIDGNVTVRNAAPTLFVDGRPTTLTLEQIPADAIQSVELITNPSAKFDASGGTASILNVVMKKNRKPGYNGSIRAGIDSRARPNLGGDFAIRQGKVNTFVNGMLGTRKSKSWSDIETEYFANGNNARSVITQDSYGEGTGYFAFLRGGMDILADIRNTVTIAGNYVRGEFNNDEENRLRYDTFYNPVKTERSVRNTMSEGFFQNIGATLGYKHIFAKAGHEFTADFNYNKNKSENDANFSNQFFTSSNTAKGDAILQRTAGNSGSAYSVAQLDYANPLSGKIKIETGARAQFRQFSSLSNNFIYNKTSNDYILLPKVSNNYKYTDRVYAAYATLTGKQGDLGYNLGLRMESSNYDGELIGKDSTFNVDFPISLFPSAFLSYKLNDKSDVQINYTRRINRPNFFQLLPFPDFNDPLNIRIGNPGLKPEFTNSFEANYTYTFNAKHNLLTSAYFKNTNNLITSYVYRDRNPVEGGGPDSVFINTYVNANRSYSYGMEFTSRNAITNKFDVLTNLNLYNATINSENLETNLNNSRFSFFGKVTLTQKLGKTNRWTIQANADYQARTVLPPGGRGGRGFGGGGPMFGSQPSGSQGYQNPSYGLDMSVRYDFIKNKSGQGYAGNLTLSVNDIARTRLYDVFVEGSVFQQSLQRRRDPQVLRLQFNWRFGKLDTGLFRRKNIRGEAEGMSEGMNMQQ